MLKRSMNHSYKTGLFWDVVGMQIISGFVRYAYSGMVCFIAFYAATFYSILESSVFQYCMFYYIHYFTFYLFYSAIFHF